MNPTQTQPNPPTRPKAAGRYLTIIARLLLGLLFLVAGLNGFFHFIPQPKEAMPEGAQALMTGFMKSIYLMPLLFGTQTLGGVLLLINRFVPLALAILAPVIVNIVAFHLFLVPSGLPIAFIVLALELFLAWHYRRCYAPMLAARA